MALPGPKLNRKQRIARELICFEMHDAMMRADVMHTAQYRCMTWAMTEALDKFYDWAAEVSNELG
jgi:hypothetical protein